MIIFDGIAVAAERETALREQVVAWKQRTGRQIRVAAVLFVEDAGSQLYTRLKKEAAQRVGIEYEVSTFSFSDPLEEVLAKIGQLNADHHITGIIIQKPWRKTWVSQLQEAGAEVTSEDFSQWWHQLVSGLDPAKDVDGLHPSTHAAIQAGTWQSKGKVLPATVRAVLTILEQAGQANLPNGRYAVVGKSDLLGTPLAAVLRHQGKKVTLLGKKELTERVAEGSALRDFEIVVTSTGHANLIKGAWLQSGGIVVDVGEPKPDVDVSSLEDKLAFLTPVPGGVGPLTVVSLLENAFALAGSIVLPQV